MFDAANKQVQVAVAVHVGESRPAVTVVLAVCLGVCDARLVRHVAKDVVAQVPVKEIVADVASEYE